MVVCWTVYEVHFQFGAWFVTLGVFGMEFSLSLFFELHFQFGVGAMATMGLCAFWRGEVARYTMVDAALGLCAIWPGGMLDYAGHVCMSLRLGLCAC